MRDGSGIYTQPFPIVVTDTPVESIVYNGFTKDVEKDLNDARPIIAGGTGANNAAEAMFNLGGELAAYAVTNFDSHLWYPGSFRAAIGATGAPNALHAFSGIVHINEPLANPPTNLNVAIEARDLVDGKKYFRIKTAGVWAPTWTADVTAADVTTGLALKADIASPTFTGDPKAPTPAPGDNDTSIATTAYVTAAVTTAVATVPRMPNECRLEWVSGNAKLSRYNGRYVTVNGVVYDLPAAGITLAPPGPTFTYYYIYLFWNGSALVLEASTTGYVTNATTGALNKNGDATRALVGAAYSYNPGLWFTAQVTAINSVYNPQRKFISSYGNPTLSSASYAQVPGTAGHYPCSILDRAYTIRFSWDQGSHNVATAAGYMNIQQDRNGVLTFVLPSNQISEYVNTADIKPASKEITYGLGSTWGPAEEAVVKSYRLFGSTSTGTWTLNGTVFELETWG